MTYRDELEAARGRIAQLEEELQTDRPREVAEDDTRLRDARDKLRAAESRIAELERLVEAAKKHGDAETLARELGSARRRISDLEAERSPTVAYLPTVVAHNRRIPQSGTSRSAAVLCPLCSLGGERVEMWHLDEEPVPQRFAKGSVICPQCRYVHLYCSG